MSATRVFQRKQWREDCPAVFNRTKRAARAEALGLKIEHPERGRRMTFQVWKEKYTPNVYDVETYITAEKYARNAGQVQMTWSQRRTLAMSANFGRPS